MHKKNLILQLGKRAILPSLMLAMCVPSAIAYANEDENYKNYEPLPEGVDA